MINPFYMNKQSFVPAPISRFRNDLAPLTRARSEILCIAIVFIFDHVVDWDCDVIVAVGNGLDGSIIPIVSEIFARHVRVDLRLVLPFS